MSTILRLAYDGTEFHGFARQDDQRTVQGCLEEALGRLYKAPVSTRGASRTDAGVHARGQVAAYEAPFEIPNEGIVLGLAAELPEDMAAVAAWVAEGRDGEPVQPRFVNEGKHYRYRVRQARIRDPLTRRTSWRVTKPLALEAMQEAARHFVGRHDFAAFRASDCQSKTTERNVTSVDVSGEALAPADAQAVDQSPMAITIDVRGEAFLKNMVRIMVGTLVEVGLGRRAPSTVADLLKGGIRSEAGQTAPARGLCLEEVFWPSTWPPSARASAR